MMAGFGEMLHGGPVDAAEVARVRDVILFEGPERTKRLQRFTVLLVLAAAIAAFGLIADSVATVIGAMIVAPLMLPIVGLAFGIAIGDRKAIVSSLLISIFGVAIAILVGWAFSAPFAWLDPESNAQIMARTAPRLVDMCAALATGLAGAFAMSRKDVGDTLPGVAIAISLVPPLANVGVLLGAGRADLAAGSMLLFITNFLAIVLTGALTFGVMGFPRAALENQSPRARRTSIALVVALSAVILIPLGAASYNVATSVLAQNTVAAAAKTWVAGSGYSYSSVTDDGELHLVITGSGSVPSTATLQVELQGRVYGKPVLVHVIPETRFTVPTQ